MSEPLAIVEKTPGGVIIRMNRPEKRNATNEPLADAVNAALDAAEADVDVRCIVLTGMGGAFNAGQDFGEATGRSGQGGSGSGKLNARLAKVEKPVIGMINGFCYGGGTVTALHCDIRLASDNATFRFPGAAYGLVVAAALLGPAIGQARAKDLIFTTRTIDAKEAYELGLVNKVVPPEKLEALALDYVQMISGSSAGALREAKKAVNLAVHQAAAFEYEREANGRLRSGDDMQSRFNAAADRIIGPRS